MKAYGGTCPLCCGDVQSEHAGQGEDAVCSFCGLAFEVLSSISSQAGPLSLAQPSQGEPHQDGRSNGYVLATILPAHAAAIGDQRAV